MHSDSSDASTLPPESTAQTSPVRRRRHAPLHQRRHGHRAGALDHQLGALEQHHHRLGHLVVGDRDDLVHVALHQRQREVAGPLDGDPVADRVGRARADRPVRPPASRCRARTPPPARPRRARPGATRSRPARSRSPARRRRAAPPPASPPAPGARSPARPCPGPPRPPASSKACTAVMPSSSASARRLGVGVVVVAAVQAHLAAVLAHRRDLGHRRLLRHHQHGAGAGVAGGAGHRLGVVAGAGGHHPGAQRLGSAGDRSCWSRRAP